MNSALLSLCAQAGRARMLRHLEMLLELEQKFKTLKRLEDLANKCEKPAPPAPGYHARIF